MVAGKPRPDGRRVHMNVKFSESEAAEIDAVRGEVERGTWLREAALSVARSSAGPAPAQHGILKRGAVPGKGRTPRTPPPPAPKAAPAEDAVPDVPAADAAPAVKFSEPEPAPPVPARAPVVVPSLRRASDLEPPPRCPHPGTRQIGGWCAKCQANVAVGGKLPADWVMPEGWSPK